MASPRSRKSSRVSSSSSRAHVSRGNAGRPNFDRAKEDIIRSLVQALSTGGLTVRREELKRGPGWKAVSGVCRVDQQRVVFLDRSTRQDEQIEFLVGRFQQFQITPSAELLNSLPEPVRHLLEGRAVVEVAA